jgi:hypothetical protein
MSYNKFDDESLVAADDEEWQHDLESVEMTDISSTATTKPKKTKTKTKTKTKPTSNRQSGSHSSDSTQTLDALFCKMRRRSPAYLRYRRIVLLVACFFWLASLLCFIAAVFGTGHSCSAYLYYALVFTAIGFAIVLCGTLIDHCWRQNLIDCVWIYGGVLVMMPAYVTAVASAALSFNCSFSGIAISIGTVALLLPLLYLMCESFARHLCSCCKYSG